jgi:hypothetical protein
MITCCLRICEESRLARLIESSRLGHSPSGQIANFRSLCAKTFSMPSLHTYPNQVRSERSRQNFRSAASPSCSSRLLAQPLGTTDNYLSTPRSHRSHHLPTYAFRLPCKIKTHSQPLFNPRCARSCVPATMDWVLKQHARPTSVCFREDSNNAD